MSVAIRIWRSTSEAAEFTSESPCDRKSRPPETLNATTTPPLDVRPRATPSARAAFASGLRLDMIGGPTENSSGSKRPSTSR
jgi:hypothetical protein